MKTAIIGSGQTEHRSRRLDVSAPELIDDAVQRALADARLEPDGIDAIVVGNMEHFEGIHLSDLWTVEGTGVTPAFELIPMICRPCSAKRCCSLPKRNSPPVARDVTKQTMLDLVPFARTRRIVGQFQNHPRLISKPLKLPQPQPCARTVAAAAVRSDQHTAGGIVTLLAQPHPPATDRRDSELGGVVADSDRNTGFIVPDVIDAVRDGLSQLFVRKIMCLHRDGTALQAVRFARILQGTERFLLFGVHRDRRFSASLPGLHATGNVFKLGIAIRMLFSFNRLAVRLQRVPLRP